LPAYGSILASKPDELWGIDTVVEETVPVWLCLIEHAVRFAFGEIRLASLTAFRFGVITFPPTAKHPSVHHLPNWASAPVTSPRSTRAAMALQNALFARSKTTGWQSGTSEPTKS